MNLKTKQTLAVIFSIAGAAGTIATTILARNAAKKEQQKIDKEGLAETNKERFKQIAPLYVPTAIVGVATITSIVGSTIMSRKAQASLMSMAMIADQGWRRYKHKVQEVLGFDTHKKVINELAKDDISKVPIPKGDNRKLYFEEHIGFFLADPEKLGYAYGDLNQRIHVSDWGNSYYYGMLYNLIESAEADILNKKLPAEALIWGWSRDYLLDRFECDWVHMELTPAETDDGKEYTIITWIEEPILDPGEHGAHKIEYPEPEYNAYFPVMGSIKEKLESKEDE